jgi:hypothetical protein
MGDEKEVRKEDQDRINRFSRLHSKEKLVEEDLKTKQVVKRTCSAFMPERADTRTERQGGSRRDLIRAGTCRRGRKSAVCAQYILFHTQRGRLTFSQIQDRRLVLLITAP